ncbi:MAG: hypothetical protein IT439_08995 [Phycisphaerales bacterium]|nr:hypothetical protein [Phycisphaerales bacterium]
MKRPLSIALTCLACSMPAQAQPEEAPADAPLLAPQVKEVGDPPTIWGYLIFALLVGLAVGVNVMPSKRGHQD